MCGLRAGPAPISWEQFIEPLDEMLGDAGQNAGEPGLRIDIVHLGRDDQAACAPPRSEPRNSQDFRPKSDRAHALGRVVREADAAVVEEACKNAARARRNTTRYLLAKICTAIHLQSLTGYPAGQVASEEQRGPCDVQRLAKAP